MATVLAAALTCVSLPSGAQEGRTEVPASALSTRDRKKIEGMLTEELQQLVDRQKRIEGQGRYATVKVTMDAYDPYIIVNLSRSYVPKYNGGEFEDLQHEIETAAHELVLGIISIKGVKFLFDGKSIYYYIPEVVPYLPRLRTGPSALTSNAVVVAAGHGLYFHHGFDDWRPQRDPSNGITEDFVTPVFVADLAALLASRSGVPVENPRSTNLTIHSPSRSEWWKVAARYHLQGSYPGIPGIWHSLPAEGGNLRERDEDIRSRPLFANHIGANALIHIHTNAADPSARGTRVFYQRGRSPDAKLGASVLCYMKEQIQAQPKYTAFPVAPQPADGDYGETRLAAMPSVIVEVGFHTNPTDASAIQDPKFRAAAMRGVEKGYRLYSEGRPCEPFRIGSIPEASGSYSKAFPVKFHFTGYPRFPVTLKTRILVAPVAGRAAASPGATPAQCRPR